MLDTSSRIAFDEDHEMFRDTVRKVFEKELIPHLDTFEEEGIIPRSFWKACGEAGLLAPTIAEENGGMGLDFTFNAVINEELSYQNVGAAGCFSMQNDIIPDYIEEYGTEEQKQKYLPGMVTGDCITGIAMTEPGTGSDLAGVRTTAKRDGNSFVINGSKTYITNGQNADMIIVVAKTDPDAGAKGISLFLIDSDTPGFERGRNLDKVGQHSADTSELFFADMRVPGDALLGKEGEGFGYLMERLAQERFSIAVGAQATAQRAFDEAVTFTKERQAFGMTVFDFQNTRFTLADIKSQLQAGWAHIDWCLLRLKEDKLTAAEASAAKQWHTDMLCRVADAALQMHGGAGYMNEYMIARLWRDARVTRIYGGTNEIMKEVVGRSL